MGFDRSSTTTCAAFGLGQRTALDFPGEIAGHPQAVARSGRAPRSVTVAYGQGVSPARPIQLVAAVNTIANDGVYVAPEARQGDRRTPTATITDDAAVGDRTRWSRREAAAADAPR